MPAFLALLPLAAALLAPGPAAGAPSGKPGVELVRGAEARAGEALVQFAAGTSAAARAAVHAAVGAREVRDLRRGVAHVAFGAEAGVEEVLRRYEAHAEVVLAEPNALRRPLLVPDDTHFGAQWGPEKVRLPEAWDLQQGDPAVVLAVFDTGLDGLHPDLPVPVHGADLLDGDADPQDVQGHGTTTTGIAAARTDNGLGIAGASFDGSLAAYRVATAGGATAADTMAALNDVVDRGYHVVNMSYGSGFSVSTEASAMQAAADEGVVLVAASGNTGTAVPRFPAAYEAVIGVANSTQSDEKASSSTFGPWSSVAAPGTGIRTTQLGGGYVTVSGTSAASPLVAGVAALLYAELGGVRSAANGALVRAALEDTAVPVPEDYVVHGRVDALRALFELSPPPAPVVSSVEPAAVQAFAGEELTVRGANLAGALEVALGPVALDAGSFTVVDDETLTFVAPHPAALGTNGVTVTTAGGSAAGSVEVTDTSPPVLSVPVVSVPDTPFEATWAGAAGDLYVLLFGSSPGTFPYAGVDVLGPVVQLGPSGRLDAVGYGELVIPSVPSLFQVFYFQVLTFDPGTVALSGATPISSTLFF